MATLKRLLDEVHRRSLWQVGSVYLAGGWFVLEVIQTLQEELLLPGWVFRYGIVLLLIGLPIVLVTSYVQRGLGSRSPPPDATSTAARPGTADGPSGPDESRGPDERSGPEGSSAAWSVSRLFTWRNALAGGVVAFALLGAATAIRMVAVRAPGLSASRGVAPSIAVFPFTVRGDAELDLYRDGLADWLSRALSVLDDVRVIDAGTVIRAVEGRLPGGILDVPTAASTARELEAGYFVLGGLTRTGDDVRLYASLYDADEPRDAMAEADVEGRPDDIMNLVGRVSAELLLPQLGPASARAVRSASRTTDSPAALKEFLAAEEAIRSSLYPEAIAHLERATAEDPDFALAWLRMSIAVSLMETDGSYSDLMASVPSALPRALALADRLSDRDRMLLEAYAAFRGGEADRAEDGFRDLLRRNPNDTEARFFLAQVLFRLNPPRGRSTYEAREEFERVLEADPDFTCPI